MDRREKFLQEKKVIEEEENEKNNHFEFDKIDYAPIEKDKISVFRFIGNPVHARTENYDPKLVYSSKIKDDKDKLFTVRWSQDSDWILNKIYTTVLSYIWDKDAERDDGKKGKKIYKYVDTYPKMVDRVLHNNESAVRYVDPSGKAKMIENSGWKAHSSIYINVIDRADYDWHKENKSFKLIAKKVSIVENSKGEQTAYYEAGIPNSLYKMLLDTVIEEKGDWQDFDIAIKKINENPFYKLYSTNDERKISEEDHAPMSDKPLTEEELSWKKFDIDKITPITRYKTIKNRLGSFIKEVDKNLSTSFYSELEELVEKEKEELAKVKENDSTDNEDSAISEDDDSDDEMTSTLVESPEPKEEKKVRTKVSDSTKDFWNQDYLKSWKKIDLLKKQFGDRVVAIKGDVITFKDKDGNIIDDNDEDQIYVDDCGCHVPMDVPFCPKCGAEFE